MQKAFSFTYVFACTAGDAKAEFGWGGVVLNK